MKLIINTSNLYIGGGMQVALSFINELKHLKSENEYHIFLSLDIQKQIEEKDFPDNFHFYLIEKSPSPLKTRKKIVAQLNTLENEIKPDIVFSIFGPTYWRPRSKHLMGFANGWATNSKSIAFKQMSLIKKFKMKSIGFIRSFDIKSNADFYVVETDDAKEKFTKTFARNKENVFVIGNTYSSVFNNIKNINTHSKNYMTLPERSNNEFRLMLISHNYPHKNLSIIRDVLPLLKNYNIKFVLTIDETSYEKLFSTFKDSVINLGTVKHESCPSIYAQADALFFPTLLETFSASYPEAMKMEKPILTSNLSFATDVCGDAALYFDPLDPKDIADKIIQLIEDKALYNELIIRGKKRLNTFETAQSRAEKYIEICEKIIKGSDES